MDKRCIYHSDEWEILVTPTYQHGGWYSWITWSVDDGIATLKWSRL